MSFKMSLKSVLAVSVFAVSTIANAEVVNINAYYNGAPGDAHGYNTPVLLALNAGTYQIEQVNSSFAGATYTAWNPWSRVAACDSQGHCPNGMGWISAYSFDLGAGTAVTSSGFNSIWATADLAFANRTPGTTVTLAAATTLRFYIQDHPHYDNAGGISLNVTPVPEPETYAMMLAGLGVLGLLARRKKSAQLALS